MAQPVDFTRSAKRRRPDRQRSRAGDRLRALALGVAIGLAWPTLRAPGWAGAIPADLLVIFPRGVRIDLPDGTGWALPAGWPRIARGEREAALVGAPTRGGTGRSAGAREDDAGRR